MDATDWMAGVRLRTLLRLVEFRISIPLSGNTKEAFECETEVQRGSEFEILWELSSIWYFKLR